MEALAKSRKDTTLRKIDVPNWKAPVVSQYKVRGLPHLILFENGKKVATGTQAVMQRLQGS